MVELIWEGGVIVVNFNLKYYFIGMQFTSRIPLRRAGRYFRLNIDVSSFLSATAAASHNINTEVLVIFFVIVKTQILGCGFAFGLTCSDVITDFFINVI